MKKFKTIIVFLAILIPLTISAQNGIFYPVPIWSVSPGEPVNPKWGLILSRSGANVLISGWDNNPKSYSDTAKEYGLKFMTEGVPSGLYPYAGAWYTHSYAMADMYPVQYDPDSIDFWKRLSSILADTLRYINDQDILPVYAYMPSTYDYHTAKWRILQWTGLRYLCKELEKYSSCKTFTYGVSNDSLKYLLDITSQIPFSFPKDQTSNAWLQETIDTLWVPKYKTKYEEEWINRGIEWWNELPIYRVEGKFRYPTESELRLMINIGFAYGMRGFTFFKYGNTSSSPYKGIIDENGKPYMPKNQALIDSIFGPGVLTTNDVNPTYTIYSDFWRVVKDLKRLGRFIREENLKWWDAASLHNTTLPWHYVDNISGAQYVEMAMFNRGKYLMLVNRHPTETKTLTVRLKDHPNVWHITDICDRNWNVTVISDENDCIEFQRTLKPGYACLLELTQFTGPTSPFDRMTAYNTGNKAEGPHAVYTGGEGDSVFMCWATGSGDNSSYLGAGRYPACAHEVSGGLIYWTWVDTSMRNIYYENSLEYIPHQLPMPDLGTDYYLSPPSIAIDEHYHDTVFVACEALSRDPVSSERSFRIIYWKFHYEHPNSALVGLVHEWDAGIGSLFQIDTLGVALEVCTTIDPAPLFIPIERNGDQPEPGIELPYRATPYFAWIENDSLYAAYIRYGYSPTGEVYIINLTDTVYQRTGIILYPCNQVSDMDMFNWESVISVVKRTSPDTLFWLSCMVPSEFFEHPYDELFNYFLLPSYDIVAVAPAAESLSYPTIARSTWVLWQQKEDETSPFEIYGRPRDWLLENWYIGIERENISGSVRDSRYPHGDVWPGWLWPDSAVYRWVFWTEDIGEGQYLLMRDWKVYYGSSSSITSPDTISGLYAENLYPPIVPYLYIRGGAPKGFSPCVYRDTFITFNEEAYGKVDVGYDSLTYLIFKLHPEKDYGMMVELYFEDSDTTSVWNALLDIDGGIKDTVQFRTGRVKRVYKSLLPKSLYQNDSIVVLQLRRLEGSFVPCSRIILWEYKYEGDTTYSGGPQGKRVKGLRVFKLYQSYPNPTTRSTVIRFQIPVKTSVSLKVYDVTGRLVRTLTRAQSLEPGVYTVEWDGRSDRGLRVPSGVYFYRLVTEGYRATRKLVWVR